MLKPATDDYDLALIGRLLEKLRDENVCPCCVATALLHGSAVLAEKNSGTIIAAEELEGLAWRMRESIEEPPLSP